MKIALFLVKIVIQNEYQCVTLKITVIMKAFSCSLVLQVQTCPFRQCHSCYSDTASKVLVLQSRTEWYQLTARVVMWAVVTSCGSKRKQPTVQLTMDYCAVTLFGIQWSEQMKRSGETETMSPVLFICISQKALWRWGNDGETSKKTST